MGGSLLFDLGLRRCETMWRHMYGLGRLCYGDMGRCLHQCVHGEIYADGSSICVWLDDERLIKFELASRTELCLWLI